MKKTAEEEVFSLKRLIKQTTDQLDIVDLKIWNWSKKGAIGLLLPASNIYNGKEMM